MNVMSINHLDEPAFLSRVLDRFPNGSINIFDSELRYLFAGGEGLAAAGLSRRRDRQRLDEFSR